MEPYIACIFNFKAILNKINPKQQANSDVEVALKERKTSRISYSRIVQEFVITLKT